MENWGTLAWRKSSRCEDAGCIEIASKEDRVLVRDSKDCSGPVLQFALPEWDAFLNGVRNGEFDLLHLRRRLDT